MVSAWFEVPVARLRALLTQAGAAPPAPPVDLDAAATALAACEMVACAQGRPPAFQHFDMDMWLEEQGAGVGPQDLALALAAAEQIYAHSELRTLWDGMGAERPEFKAGWHAAVQDLLGRLRGEGAG